MEHVKKQFEIKTYEHKGIKVCVQIDYIKKNISLLEQPQPRAFKQWVFAERGIDYMDGWQNILDAMKYAIAEATKDLRKLVDSEGRFMEKVARRILAEEK